MSIKVGDKMPSVEVKHLTAEGMDQMSTDEIFAGKKVVLFAVPGAYTPTCTAQHLPGFQSRADALKAKGVNTIVCMAVNDPFVMKAWGDQAGLGGDILLFPDGNAELTKAMGLELDGSGAGLGLRSKRFAMIVDDGVVSHLAVEDGTGLDVSSAEKILEAL